MHRVSGGSDQPYAGTTLIYVLEQQLQPGMTSLATSETRRTSGET